MQSAGIWNLNFTGPLCFIWWPCPHHWKSTAVAWLHHCVRCRKWEPMALSPTFCLVLSPASWYLLKPSIPHAVLQGTSFSSHWLGHLVSCWPLDSSVLPLCFLSSNRQLTIGYAIPCWPNGKSSTWELWVCVIQVLIKDYSLGDSFEEFFQRHKEVCVCVCIYIHTFILQLENTCSQAYTLIKDY